MLTIQDLEHNQSIVLLTDSQDMQSVLDSIGQSGDIQYYGSLLVEAGKGEYISIYGCPSSVPRLTSSVDKLYPVESMEVEHGARHNPNCY